MKNYSENDRLMREMGSTKGFDPMPPDQYLIFLHKRYPTVLRMWACVASTTIRQGRRSALCVDENGRYLGVKDLARSLKIDTGQATRALQELEELGQVRRNGHGIWFCGDIPTLEEAEAKIKRTKNYVQINYSGVTLTKIKNWEPEVRNSFLAAERADCEAERRFLADLVAEGRAIFAERKDTRWKAHGLSVKRLPQRRVKPSPLRPVLTQYVQSAFSFEKSPSVQTENASVQGEETGENGICTPDSPRASLYRETETEIRHRAAAAILSTQDAPPPLLPDPTEELLRERLNATLGRHGLPLFDPAAAHALAQAMTGHSADEIIELCNTKLAQNRDAILSGKIANPVGFLLKTVPLMSNGYAASS